MSGMKNFLKINKCRVCGQALFQEPLLRYKNMPRAVQYLPDAKSLKNDRGINLEVSQCSGCGLVQLNNVPVPYYREVIRAAGVSGEMNDFRTKQFNDFAKKYALKDRKVIEIGCGRGEYLSIMSRVGLNAYGLEYNEASVNDCVKNNLRVSGGFVESDNYKIDSAPFSAFFILNFFEHLPDPNSTLRGIYNNLADGAVGIVEVPNFDMILRNRLFSEFMRDHLLYFTKETLITALSLNGFEVIECNVVWYDYIISAVVKKKGKMDFSSFDKHQKKIIKELKEFIDSFDGKDIAVWGAGHQAFAILSFLNSVGKIKYVVDSAAFKQGKFSPVTHIPIVSLKHLVANPVGAIIIMAGSYSDEVKKIIMEKFDKKIKIAILRDYGLEIV